MASYMNNVPFGLKWAATLCILRYQDKFLLLNNLKHLISYRYIPVGGITDPFDAPLQSAIGKLLRKRQQGRCVEILWMVDTNISE
jgi:8-oxo-dGTP diphosphatase